jgi:hypothetical protein
VTQGVRVAVVRLLVGLAVVTFVGAGALLAIGPNLSTDWRASDCGAPVRWLTGDHADAGPTIVPFSSRAVTPLPNEASCGTLVWRQIHWAAGLGAIGLGLVAASIVVAHTRRRHCTPVSLSAI